MSEESEGVSAEHRGGVLASLKTLMTTLVAVVCTRLEILATEVEEEKIRLARIMLLGFLAVFFLGMALIFASILVITLYWNDHRVAALGGITLLYILLTIMFASWLRLQMSRKSRLFAGSLAELRKDHAELNT